MGWNVIEKFDVGITIGIPSTMHKPLCLTNGPSCLVFIYGDIMGFYGNIIELCIPQLKIYVVMKIEKTFNFYNLHLLAGNYGFNARFNAKKGGQNTKGK